MASVTLWKEQPSLILYDGSVPEDRSGRKSLQLPLKNKVPRAVCGSSPLKWEQFWAHMEGVPAPVQAAPQHRL